MRRNGISNLSFAVSVILVTLCTLSLFAETIYVDSANGRDSNDGTKEKPIQTFGQAANLVNSSSEAGPSVIKIAPGTYEIEKAVIFENERSYTEKNRLIIEATILPDDPNWKPALMPIISSTENPGKPDVLTETHSFKVKLNHVTIRGLKLMGNPSDNNWHGCIERIGENLDDMVVRQCVFDGKTEGSKIYSAALATGDRFIVENCIFKNCHACTVFWDGLEGIGGKGNAMRNCIVDGAYISGVWTCQTEEDFGFSNNIVTNCEYLWMRKRGDEQKYRLEDCIVTGNKYYSGYGVASGARGQTGPEVTFEEKNVIKAGEVVFVKDESLRNYLHVKPGTLGSELCAGLFKKP
jgi:hypothetical protein